MKLQMLKSLTTLALSVTLTLMLCLPTQVAYAQPEDANIGLELTPTFGFMFGGRLRGYDGEINVEDGFTYGVTLSKAIRPGTWVEFNWNGMHTMARYRDYFEFTNDENFDMNIDYFLISSTQYWRSGSDNILPFGTIGVGASVHTIENSVNFYDGSEWFFSMQFGLGAKIHLNKRIGIRLQGRMLMPVTWGGVNLWCGTGGCGTGVYTTSSILQGDLSGGLIFRF